MEGGLGTPVRRVVGRDILDLVTQRMGRRLGPRTAGRLFRGGDECFFLLEDSDL